MNQQEEMRIAIAEACGWSDIKQGPYDGSPFGRHETHQLLPLPDLCNDLNAMHEAEGVLLAMDNPILSSPHPSHIYEHHLAILTRGRPLWVNGERHAFYGDAAHIAHATATQRAEAFCRTLKIGPFKEPLLGGPNEVTTPKTEPAESLSGAPSVTHTSGGESAESPAAS